jgi:hypothetical protein
LEINDSPRMPYPPSQKYSHLDGWEFALAQDACRMRHLYGKDAKNGLHFLAPEAWNLVPDLLKTSSGTLSPVSRLTDSVTPSST